MICSKITSLPNKKLRYVLQDLFTQKETLTSVDSLVCFPYSTRMYIIAINTLLRAGCN